MKARRVLYIIMAFILLLTACGPSDTDDTGDGDGTATPAPVDTLVLDGPGLHTKMLWHDGTILVYIPQGEFIMGVEGGEDNPAHPVYLDGYWMYQTEVTNQQYAACVEAGGCKALPDYENGRRFWFSRYWNHPVTGINYYAAHEYCQWIGGELPTEAQWERSAVGHDNRTYPWGETAPYCDLLNFNYCLGIPTEGDTAPVTDYNPEGKSFDEILNMGGNVFEWVLDYFDPEFYPASPYENPAGPDTMDTHSVRGGGYQSPAEDIPSAKRFSFDPDENRIDLGFRCVVSMEEMAKLIPPYCYMPPFQEPCDDGFNLVQLNNLAQIPGNGDGNGQNGNNRECETPEFELINTFLTPDGTGVIVLEFTGPISSPDDYTVVANDMELTCTIPEGSPNRLACYGAGLKPGTSVEVSVCGPCEPTNGDNGEKDGDDGQNGEPPCEPGLPNCLPGYMLNMETNLCGFMTMGNPPAIGEPCPEGYLTVKDYGCLPLPDPNGNCPPGYYFDTGPEACVPAGKLPDCFYGFAFQTEALESCFRDCLPGYYFDPELQCCMPEGNNMPNCFIGTIYETHLDACIPVDSKVYPDCPPGFYYDTYYEKCLPMNDCPEGQYYNYKLEKCEPIPEDHQCADGYYWDEKEQTCLPIPGGTQQPQCPEGHFWNPEKEICEPIPGYPGDPRCPEGQQYDEKRQTCVPIPEDHQCPEGFYFNEKTGACEPGQDPNQPCVTITVRIPQFIPTPTPTATATPVPGSFCSQFTNNDDCFLNGYPYGCYWDYKSNQCLP